MSNPLQRRGAAVEPREIMQEGDAGVRITWADGEICHYTAPTLRRLCPCAQCVNEWTGERMLQPREISDALQIADLQIVGRYALNFKWNDGHETGIYSFRLLREMCDKKLIAEASQRRTE
ncbi:MAG: DUF971 domain-containing protein [Pyrinomonadaceae bacterium]|nr:DUF971 domain-containing protein [Pyrinomonadaceae bacterium]